MDERETGGLSEFINISVGTRIMLTVNDNKTPGLENSARGIVKDMHKNDHNPNKHINQVFVDFDEINEIQWFERKDRYIQVMPGCHVYRSMFPLVCSYAMII